ncbi:Phosphoethanolamine N-methyltransferase 1 [Madurella mycetomatis]|uniref:Phosphoethanolamine N-methyltransferase 1 n=1 Tax=Madurella mycetomatis TaxID=100816 RepID=A0A175W8R1_9PEZI|nr:Phosphoethanolamine N-methyltransferase 1 [Madurella mycetomatis]KXX82439.1 Phosphoethanolamine N-methyltransferase 1 [Madurella mycetomatis]
MADTSPNPTGSSPGPATTTASPPPAATTLPAGPGVIEADIHPRSDDDADSSLSLGSDQSETTSITSSVFRFREENGRRYHAYKAGTYFMPNDDKENDRLDLQHNIFILMQDNRLYSCPAGKSKPLKRVLDGGCGTGIWSMDFADDHPETAVVGVDLSPIQPSFVPPNVEFFVDDLESEWSFSNKFDFIYLRFLTGSIKNWPRLFEQAYAHMTPGGYIELCDVAFPLVSDDGTLTEDCAQRRWSTAVLEATEKAGSPLNSALKYEQQLADAGFKDIVHVEYKWPSNTWPKDRKYKELGAWSYENNLQGIQAASLVPLTRVLGWTVEEVEALLVEVRKEMKDRNIHAYWPM